MLRFLVHLTHYNLETEHRDMAVFNAEEYISSMDVLIIQIFDWLFVWFANTTLACKPIFLPEPMPIARWKEHNKTVQNAPDCTQNLKQETT